MTYLALSPDRIPIYPIAYTNRKQAQTALKEWVLRYKAQGYYRDNQWNKIPLDEILDHCEIVKRDEV